MIMALKCGGSTRVGANCSSKTIGLLCSALYFSGILFPTAFTREEGGNRRKLFLKGGTLC